MAGSDDATGAAWPATSAGGARELRSAFRQGARAWQPAEVVARDTVTPVPRALRVGAAGAAALVWSGSGQSIHVALREATGTWHDQRIDTVPAEWSFVGADALMLPNGHALIAWIVTTGYSSAARGVTWVAEVSADQVVSRQALGGGPSFGSTQSVGLTADARGGAWLAVTADRGGDAAYLGWGRWSGASGLQTMVAAGALRRGFGAADESPLLDADGAPQLVRMTHSSSGDEAITVTTLPASGTSPARTTGRLPVHGIAPAAVRPWVSLHGSPTEPSAARDARGGLVVVTGVAARYSGNNDIATIGWEPTATAWAFTLRANGRWARDLIDPLAGSPHAPAVTLRRGSGGRLTATWLLGVRHGGRCDDVAFAADRRDDGTWLPRRIVAVARGRHPSTDTSCSWDGAWAAATGGQEPMVAIVGNDRLAVQRIAPTPARRARRPQVSLVTRTWNEVRRRRALLVRCSAAAGAICGIDAYPTFKPVTAPARTDDPDVAECFDDRPTSMIGRGGSVVLRFPMLEPCPDAAPDRVDALQLHVVLDRQGWRPFSDVQQVRLAP